MKFYVAGKFGAGEGGVKQLVARLEECGHQIVYDWTADDTPRKPYLDNRGVNAPAAQKMLEAAAGCDAFILLAGDNLLGALIEFGIALGSSRRHTGKRLYVVGEGVRQSIFYALPQVTVCTGMHELLADIDRTGMADASNDTKKTEPRQYTLAELREALGRFTRDDEFGVKPATLNQYALGARRFLKWLADQEQSGRDAKQQ